MPYKQDPPFCIQIEPTEGCQLRCNFCGLNSIRGPVSEGLGLKFMTVETIVTVAKQVKELGWNPRWELAMHGEPSLNPNIDDIIWALTEILPDAYILMESNGAGFVGAPATRILRLLSVGLDTLALDQYQNVNLVPRIREGVAGDMEQFVKARVKVLNYPADGPDANPHQRCGHRRLIFVAPIDVSTTGTHSTLSNHAGGGAPKNNSRVNQRCAKPFREMAIRHDGSVALCCEDWRGSMKTGNIHEEGLEYIWHGPVFEAARRKLYAKRRDFGTCNGCDSRSYRTGLLPDKFGKVILDPPSIEDDMVLADAYSGPSYTKPVLRDWELVNIT